MLYCILVGGACAMRIANANYAAPIDLFLLIKKTAK
jgi:hypothetical protein